jgi:hypothetical protein
MLTSEPPAIERSLSGQLHGETVPGTGEVARLHGVVYDIDVLYFVPLLLCCSEREKLAMMAGLSFLVVFFFSK